MELTQQQKIVFERIKDFMASDASVFILRGYAGTGKTTMIKVIADYISKTSEVLLMAPTGRAARVLSSKTGRDASTIHKAIYSKATLICKETKVIEETDFRYVFPINTDVAKTKNTIIVDESSMLCSKKVEQELFSFGTDNLMDDLLTFTGLDSGNKIIFVGDPMQLPPVGESESNALKADFFRERDLGVTEVELKEVLRQKGDSVILKNAMMIRDLADKSVRNRMVFDEKENEVENIPNDDFLNRILGINRQLQTDDSIVICYSNRTAAQYNRAIRAHIFGEGMSLNDKDILQVVQNNYQLGWMNGDFVRLKFVGEEHHEYAPVFVAKGEKKEREIIDLTFLNVVMEDVDGNEHSCFIFKNLLDSDNPSFSYDERRALFINFCMRHHDLKRGSLDFIRALEDDPYFNCLMVKYGYAVTGHKCQGGEWSKVFVDYSGRSGLSNDCLRWIYTATTRAKDKLYFTNLPHVTPFSKFRIEPIQLCKNINSEFRILGEVPSTPFHSDNAEVFLKAKYHCIVKNMEGTPYSVYSVTSKPYLEIYQIQTPDGLDRYDIHYKAGGVFHPVNPNSRNEHTVFISTLMNHEGQMPIVFNYKPSSELFQNIYSIICSICDDYEIQITNIVEHISNFYVDYYLHTGETHSYIQIYISKTGFITYAKPMSLMGANDEKLCLLIDEIQNRMI